MKLLNILGAVVVVHIAVLILAVAIPGCRTTSSSSSPAPAAPPMSTPAAEVGELQDRDLNPPLANATASAFDPNAPAVSSTAASSRYSPTRPSSTSGTSLNPVILPESAPVTQSVVTYTVKGGDNLWTLAKKNGVSVRELASANDLAPDSGLRLGQVLVIPVEPSVAANPTTAAADTSNLQSYTIRPGDTLAKIARAHGTTVSQLKVFNNLRSDMVRAGDTLSIPGTERSETVAASSTATTATATTKPAAASAPKQGAYQHVVAPGESLTVIAQKYDVKIGAIALANNIRNPALIRPGQSLVIPGWEAPAKTAAPKAVTTPAIKANGGLTILSEDDDLDAGFDDDDLDNVPVITVEDGPIETISTEGGKDGGPAIFE